MAKDFQLIRLTVDQERPKQGEQPSTQSIRWLYAHNELTVLNRLLMFTMNDTGDGELHNSAQSVQMWFMLQLLAAKLFETWVMLTERFLQSNPPDVVGRLEPAARARRHPGLHRHWPLIERRLIMWRANLTVILISF